MATHTHGFELYVWPPIPGVPSLDADCIAVIAFLTRILPRDAGLSIITTYDASVSPSRTLPCLRRDDVCVHGSYRSFVKYFQLPGQGLDDGLNAIQQAEALALGHHVQNAAQALIDYHLYTNADNYSSVTHRAHSRYLPWPYGWLYPLHRFSKAERRAGTIGLADQPSILKADAADGALDDPVASDGMDTRTSPSLVFARSRKAQKRLKEQVGVTRFRLESAIDALCEPLDGQFQGSGGAYMLDGNIRSVDCHAYGFLASLLHTRTPDSSAPDVLRKRWPRVAQYAERLAQNLRTSQIEKLSTEPDDLATFDSPSLSVQPPPTFLRRASVFLSSLTSLIIPSTTRIHLIHAVRTLPLTLPILVIGVLGASTGAATLVYAGYTLLTKKVPRDALIQRDLTFKRPGTGLGAMGASGAALAALLGSPTRPFHNRAAQQQQTSNTSLNINKEVKRMEPQGIEVAEVDVGIATH